MPENLKPFTSPSSASSPPRPASPCWIVRQRGAAAELLHVGAANSDKLAAELEILERWPWHDGPELAKTHRISAHPDGAAIGIVIEDCDADPVWRDACLILPDAVVLYAINRLTMAAIELAISRAEVLAPGPVSR